ncbi:MAG: esterase-like activity of phytase family protein [Sulfitobacter sp.]
MRRRAHQQLIGLALTLFLAGCAPLAGAGPALRQGNTITWSLNQPWFGGWSGAEISTDGRSLSVISDKGRLLHARLERGAGGRLMGITALESFPLIGANGKELHGKMTDAEGLARDAAGNLYISFEHAHRVMRLDPATGRTSAFAKLSPDMVFQKNSGLEALAVTPEGQIFALPERSGGEKRPFPVYTYAQGSWQITAHIPRRGPFLPVGADFDDQGLLWLLERTATPLGFRSRIRRFDLARPDLAEQTLLTTFPSQFDNLETLTLWRDHGGKLRVLLLSDDNFLSIQRSQITEFILDE